jgi:ABC-2 type transport system ATP-binding protein
MPDVLDPELPGRGSREITAITAVTTTSAAAPVRLTPTPAGPLVVLERVSKWYGNVIGVNQVTLELRPGIVGLVGANGSGKSTLMRLTTGQLRPDLGKVEVLGHPAWTGQAKRHVGYCPEVDAFYEEMSGRQFVRTMARLSGYTRAEARRRTEAALQQVGMEDRADKVVRGYSKGMRQRIKVAQALVHDPAVLVLDEPLSGIDPVGRAEFIAIFRRLADQGKCLLISTHELDELDKLTDHVAIMARGRIAAVGSIAQIRDRLDNYPLAIRIDLQRGSDGPAAAETRRRELAGALLKLTDVVDVELPEQTPSEDDVTRVLVRARNPQRFFRELTRLVLEEWYEIRHLETIDDSTEAVLGYLLGGSR